MENIADLLGQTRKELIAQGYTEDQAYSLVVELIRLGRI